MTRAEKLKFIASRASVIEAAKAMIERHGVAWLTGGQVDEIYDIERQISDLGQLLTDHQQKAA